jgi:hypothetical protein
MNTRSCQSPLEWPALLEYWLGELDPDSEARIEEHYLGCAQCSHRLEQLIALARDVRALTKRSGVNVIINDEFVRKLTADGLHVREYRLPHNGSVNCTVAPEDDIVVAYLEAPLDEVKQLAMAYIDDEGNSQLRLDDIPFTAANGSIVFSPSIDSLRALPATTLRVRLLAVDNYGDRTLGEYRFNHTPHTQQGAE